MSTSRDYPQLGRYQVINRIASGGMAEVFLAKAVGAMGFQRMVAVKLIHSNFTRDPEFVKMFIDEARIAMHLHHRNIVQVFDLDEVAGTYFIAMEYVHGVNLYGLYERVAEQDRWIDAPLALYLIAEVCKGLHFAHTRMDPQGQPLNIVHRDVSPQNVLLSFEGEVKITDFGIATAAQRLHHTAAGIVKGKYAYMAPERIQEKPFDARVDVFSAGVLLYELLTGENPFAGASAVETIDNVLKRDVPPPSARGAPVTLELDQICLKALARDPDDRFSDAQTLADVLTEYAMDLTVARKDMAAGDLGVAQLLAELFPERAGQQPTAAAPGSISVPGVGDEPSLEDDEFGEMPDRGDVAPSALDDDFDAPTVLKLDPVSGLKDAATPLSQPGRPDEAVAESRRNGPTEPAEVADAPPASSSRSAAEAMRRPVQRATPMAAMPSAPYQRTKRPRVSGPAHPPTPTSAEGPTQGPTRPTDSAFGESQDAMVVPVKSSPSRSRRTRNQGLNIVAALLLVVALGAVAAATVAVVRGQFSASEVLLKVRTQPAGASVFVNGHELARSTPLEEPIPSDKPVDVKLVLSGHEPIQYTLTPQRGQPLILDEVLKPVEGQLTVIPTPPSAFVYIDGGRKGSGRVRVGGLPLDQQVRVRVELAGYSTFSEEVRLTSREPDKTLVVRLTADPRAKRRPIVTRKVTLTAPYGRWAAVYYRGEKIGSTPFEAELPIGPVKLRLRNDELQLDKEVRIRVPRSGTSRIRLPL